MATTKHLEALSHLVARFVKPQEILLVVVSLPLSPSPSLSLFLGPWSALAVI